MKWFIRKDGPYRAACVSAATVIGVVDKWCIMYRVLDSACIRGKKDLGLVGIDTAALPLTSRKAETVAHSLILFDLMVHR